MTKIGSLNLIGNTPLIKLKILKFQIMLKFGLNMKQATQQVRIKTEWL